jgi:hypothetical protein
VPLALDHPLILVECDNQTPTMPIRPFLAQPTELQPELVEAISKAFEEVCLAVGWAERNAPPQGGLSFYESCGVAIGGGGASASYNLCGLTVSGYPPDWRHA